MLGLREEVHRDPVRLGPAVADDEDLRRSRDHVDADLAEHLALRGSDIGVARADDLVDARHALRAEGEHGDRSEEHTSELQSRRDLVCRLVLEKKNADMTDPDWEPV